MTIVIGSGISSQIVAVDEVDFGVAPSLASNHGYEFKSETLELKKTTVQGQGLHGGGLYDRARRRVLATYEASGNITMDLPGNGLGLLLRHMLGSFTPVGDSSAVNVGPIENGTTGAYTQIHQPGTLKGHSLCVQKGVPATDGTVEPFTYTGCKIESWTLSCEVNQIAQLELTLDARAELAGSASIDPANAAVPALAIPGYFPGMELFHFREATLLTGAPTTNGTTGVCSLSSPTPLGQVTKASIQHAVTLDKERFFLGSNGFKDEQLENGFRKITGSFDVEFQSAETMYTAFAEDIPLSVELKFVGPVIGSGSDAAELDIIIPSVFLDGEAPKVSGPGVVSQSVAFTGDDDEVNPQIQVTYKSTDSVV